MCCLVTAPGELVVLSRGDAWLACGPWSADDLLLVVSAQRLTDPPLEESEPPYP
ncbi:hypothetical protein OG381_47075 [Streptomyces sp. NBC_00490]|uniref:hypothetical protein n=1 Tax=Streptomyces sp. NBC_00490 TaxID=2903657 RepID=UPI002E1728FE